MPPESRKRSASATGLQSPTDPGVGQYPEEAVDRRRILQHFTQRGRPHPADRSGYDQPLEGRGRQRTTVQLEAPALGALSSPRTGDDPREGKRILQKMTRALRRGLPGAEGLGFFRQCGDGPMTIRPRRRRRKKPPSKHLTVSVTDEEWETIPSYATRRWLSIARLATRDRAQENERPPLALDTVQQRELLALLEGDGGAPSLIADIQTRIVVMFTLPARDMLVVSSIQGILFLCGL